MVMNPIQLTPKRFLRQVASRYSLLAVMSLCFVLASAPAAARSIEPLGPARDAGSSPDTAAFDALISDIQALADDFNLSPAQRALIAMTLAFAAPQASEIATGLGEGRHSINEALLADPVDSAAIEALAASQGQGMADLASLGVDTLIAVRRALTEEQRQLLVELRALLETHLGSMAGEMKIAADRQGLNRAAMRRAGRVTGDGLEGAGSVLGLTASQRAEIRAIVDGAAPEALAIASDLAANRNALLELARNTPDERAAIDALIDEQAVLFESLALLRADIVLQVRDVLTPEQLGLIAHLRRALQDRLAELVGDGFGGF